MKPINIRILPVYSEQHQEKIGNMQLHKHQVENWDDVDAMLPDSRAY